MRHCFQGRWTCPLVSENQHFVWGCHLFECVKIELFSTSCLNNFERLSFLTCLHTKDLHHHTKHDFTVFGWYIQNHALYDGADIWLIYSNKYCKILLCMTEQIFCANTCYETWSFKIVQARYRKKFNFNTFSSWSRTLKLMALVKIVGLQITQEECTHIINNFTHHISTVLSTEHWTSGVSTLGLLLTFLVHVWD